MTDETSVTVTGAAPGLIIALKRAAAIAAEHGHNYVGVEDVLAAVLEARPYSILDVHWPRIGVEPLDRNGINDFDPSAPQQALTLDDLRELARSIVPGPVQGEHGPELPAVVSFELSGPHANEFREVIERQS
jgi:hypothetical protein